MTFPFTSIGFWLARRAALTPNRIALEVGERTFTYAELDARAARCAGALAAMGVRAGDRVAAVLGNANEYVEVFFACARLGVIIVPVSTRLAAEEMRFIVEDSGCGAVIYDAAHAEAVATFGIDAMLVTGDAYEAALATSDPRAPVEADADDTLAIFYTSGTTGRQKGAMLTHGNVFWTNLNMVVMLGFAQTERSLVVLPLFHVGGWNVNTLAVWWQGGTVVLEPAFDAARALDRIERGRITSMMGVPAVYQMMAEHPRFADADLSSLRACVCGGAPLPVPLIERYQARGVPFTQGYGLTEAAPNCLLLPPEDAERKAGAAGKPYFFIDVRVVDADDREVSPGGTGEVVVRGPSVMKGYWNLPEETARALRGGWLRTGDVGRVDDEGYIWIVDRVKDMFISGGENVYPAEVERVLHEHPAIAEAAVIGIPDQRWGEVGRAIVVARDGGIDAEAIRAFCAERLAKFKIPASIVFADELPRNATGKLIKQALRARYGGTP